MGGGGRLCKRVIIAGGKASDEGGIIVAIVGF